MLFYISASVHLFFFLFFFNDPATTEIYTLSLHDALPICWPPRDVNCRGRYGGSDSAVRIALEESNRLDRKSTRLNSSHTVISYAVFCLKKKKKNKSIKQMEKSIVTRIRILIVSLSVI